MYLELKSLGLYILAKDVCLAKDIIRKYLRDCQCSILLVLSNPYPAKMFCLFPPSSGCCSRSLISRESLASSTLSLTESPVDLEH